MITVAWIVLVLWALSFVPGTAYKAKPALDYRAPKLYIGLSRELATLAILIWLVTR